MSPEKEHFGFSQLSALQEIAANILAMPVSAVQRVN
jgi:hypothetical protein